MGSAGVKAMAVVTGEADVYVHVGGQYEWDLAAPVAVARSARVHVSRIDGAPLMYKPADAWLPDLLVCRAEKGRSAPPGPMPVIALWPPSGTARSCPVVLAGAGCTEPGWAVDIGPMPEEGWIGAPPSAST